MRLLTPTAVRSALFGGAVALLHGCTTVGPNYQPPEPIVPAAWRRDAVATPAAVAPAAAAPALSQWWTIFHDPLLTELVARAQAENRDVRQAEARLRQARAQRGLAAADRQPTLAAGASAGRNHSHSETGGGVSSSLFTNTFDASWEADLFGGRQRAVEAASATMEAAAAQLADVQVSLVAEVALNYVSWRSYQQRLSLTEANLATQTATYDLTRWRQQAELVTQLDVDQARMSLEQTRAALPALRTGLTQADHQLAILLGQTPGSLSAPLAAPQPVPMAADAIAIGVPADALRRRPDVRSAERQLAAQTAQIGVAAAARYPDFTLSGSIGLEALTPGGLYTAGTRTAQAALRAGWTLFDGGRVRQKVAIQTALQEEALGAYEAAVLTALREVEDALTAYANERTRRQALLEAATAGQSACALARERYASGLADFQAVLSSQQSLLTVQDALASSDATVTSDLIRLYKALGGGWENATPSANTPPVNP